MSLYQKELLPELLPCPFCGGKAKLEWKKLFWFFGPIDWQVKCTVCSKRWQESDSDAIDAWNMRSETKQNT